MRRINKTLIFIGLSAISFTAFADTQAITGAQAFFADAKEQQLVIRIGVDPKSLSQHEKTTQAILDKITVVGCSFGECEFAKPNYGLGFYEINVTPTQSLQKVTSFKLLVVACSKLGCVKQGVDAEIFRPKNKN